MKKRMITSFLLWSFLLLMIAIVVIFSDSIYGLLGMILWILLPILTWGMNLFVQRGISAEMRLVPTASKTEKVTGQLILKNKSIFASGKAICQIECHNLLTGEKQAEILDIPLKVKQETQSEFIVSSLYCGYIRIYLKKVLLTDCFGFLTVRCSAGAEKNISILPDTFRIQVELQLMSTATEEAEVWSQERKGEDYTEVFSLRDYMEGDELRQIHWKLSSKRQTLIVKEASLPTTKSLLIFWDKNTMEAAADEMDAMAEVVASVTQAILEKGIVFTLGWTEGRSYVFEDIDSEDAWIQALPRMVKSGADALDTRFIGERIKEQGKFGKVIYFAKKKPEDAWELYGMHPVYVLCGEKEKDDAVHTFLPANYRQELEAIEL